ncbi:hypothetical protein DPMN_140446 [Dreissena polymorpha]|uniref:Uncharacterized protein n=1 Tax=Dreissena polymorpha TaxID=45954 RepID=A0A9D4GBJ5_DREPO|nr:hypothetical protein DPMN_140446 [Dreissena polymorpha]
MNGSGGSILKTTKSDFVGLSRRLVGFECDQRRSSSRSRETVTSIDRPRLHYQSRQVSINIYSDKNLHWGSVPFKRRVCATKSGANRQNCLSSKENYASEMGNGQRVFTSFRTSSILLDYT